VFTCHGVPVEFPIIVLGISFESIFYLTNVAKVKKNRSYYYDVGKSNKRKTRQIKIFRSHD
jgi:hypothetical protein|tara:strand:+ start:475 stop:657 length:183 start_codon:yes stop_codon:yes gene_type:complete